MALKNYNPVTPSQRQLVLVDRTGLYKGKPVKGLTEGKHSSGGRNTNGRTTVRFRGGGHKAIAWSPTSLVSRLEYDPNRTAFLAC
jgi:large subunit ribosomal protein L2